VRVLNQSGEVSSSVNLSDPITLEMEFCVLRAGFKLNPVFHVFNEHIFCMMTTSNLTHEVWGERQYPGTYRARCIIPAHLSTTANIASTPRCQGLQQYPGDPGRRRERSGARRRIGARRLRRCLDRRDPPLFRGPWSPLTGGKR
jgi:hypothetical protein